MMPLPPSFVVPLMLAKLKPQLQRPKIMKCQVMVMMTTILLARRVIRKRGEFRWKNLFMEPRHFMPLSNQVGNPLMFFFCIFICLHYICFWFLYAIPLSRHHTVFDTPFILYTLPSCFAMISVSVTMIIAALAVIYINTDQTRAAGEAALTQTYQVFSISDDQSGAKNLGLSLVNSLIIVCAIGLMTFFIVLLYKYKCMKLLIGYMVFASTMLLGFLGGQMFYVAINKYRLAIDQISFYLTMYNFAIVGVIAVFYQKGIPTYINQTYLVLTSVIVAWQLSYFNEWMAWALLIMLALYDLCAVLTPCGPLKALVNLMSKEDAPNMPGLLYEAQLPANATRPGRPGRMLNNNAPGESRAEAQQNTASNESAVDGGDVGENTVGANSVVNVSVPEMIEENTGVAEALLTKRRSKRSTRRNEVSEGKSPSPIDHHAQSGKSATSVPSPLHESQHVQSKGSATLASLPMHAPTSRTISLPLAIAKIYKLPLASPGSLGASSLDTSSQTAYLEQEFSAAELQTYVQVKLPGNGGRIERTLNKKGEPQYVVYNKDGEEKRTLVVGKEGTVLEIVQNEDYGKPDLSDNTIKLGLGDFIFYSVLVSKAAGSGFAAFIACFMSILTGLGGTLVLLAVYHHALPALPISIFLAVIMFVLTYYCMEPWIQELWRAGPYYV
mmetsp:Transcript_26013/g.47172  ORF Transcript_26013/g.47172 Transcript_26013/m.47172 type:complete len:668 (-) Transcript_26013:2297-4300(-)